MSSQQKNSLQNSVINMFQQKHLISRRGACGIAASVGCSLGLSACTQKKDPEQNSKPSNLFHISFVLDYTPNTNHTGIYVAQQKGFYTEEGLEVEIIQPSQDGADALIGSGSAQIGVSYQDYLAQSLSADQPLPYTAIAALLQHNTSGIMSRKADGITHPKALEHHRYATWNLPVEQKTIQQVVRDDNGDYSAIQMVPYEVDDEVAGLKANMFDAVWVFEGWAVQNAHVNQYDVNYFSFRSINNIFDFYTPVLAANDDFIKSHPEKVEAFLKATRKGYEFAVQNPDAAAQILLDMVPELDEKIVRASQAFLSSYYIDDAPYWGYIDAARWARYYQWLKEVKIVKDSFDTSCGFTNKFLSQEK